MMMMNEGEIRDARLGNEDGYRSPHPHPHYLDPSPIPPHFPIWGKWGWGILGGPISIPIPNSPFSPFPRSPISPFE